ncbi:MAG: hypothetical protein WCJ74_01440 [bacterium]
MSIVWYILKEMYDKELNYKGYRCNIFGIPKTSPYNRDSFKSTLCRLKRGGYISENDEGMGITPLGRKYVEKKLNSFKQFDSPFNKKSPRNLILSFDIPEGKKAERDWLRWHLKKFNYILIQKSLWVGPSPLPEDFLNYLRFIKLTKHIKTFKLPKSYISKK